MRLRKILVPLDGSSLAEAALPTAVEMAKASGAELLLLRAAHARTFLAVDSAEAEIRVVGEAEAYLDAVEKRLAAGGLTRIRTAVWYGAPAPCIVEATQLYGVDLIVLSTHGRSGLGRLILGSVAESVLRGTRAPILVLRDGQAPLELPMGMAVAQPRLLAAPRAWQRVEAGAGPAERWADH
jgi:nucleotide-binding universal stress UspA family protein